MRRSFCANSKCKNCVLKDPLVRNNQYAEGKHSFEEIAQLYGIYMDPLKLARDFDNLRVK